MQSRETVKLGLAGVFWELLQTDDVYDEIRYTVEVEDFCDDVFNRAVGMNGDVQCEYYRDRLEEFVKIYAEKHGLKVFTDDDDRLELGEDIKDMDDFLANADEIEERIREGQGKNQR